MNPEIKTLIVSYKEDNSKDTLIKLWEYFKPLVLNCIRKFFIPLKQREDIYQDAFLILLECANDYDISTCVPFESYFKMQLHYWFYNQFRKKSEVLTIDKEWENGISMTDLMQASENVEENVELLETRKALKKAFLTLTNKQKLVINLFYLQGFTIVDIANQLGCSYGVISKRKASALNKIKRELNTLGYHP